MRFFLPIVFIVWLVLAVLSARIFVDPIEDGLRAAARGALDDRGLGMVQVEFDHLDATLSGIVPAQEMRAEAAAVIGEIAAVRLRENRITYGEFPPAKLVFEAGDPVRVGGVIGSGREALEGGLGDGFDTTNLEAAPRAEIPFIGRLGVFAEEFFDQVDGGYLELDGSRLLVGGEVPNPQTKWRLIDQGVGMDAQIDLVDHLRVTPPRPFAISIQTAEDGLRYAGVARDETSVLAVGGGSPGAERGAISFDPAVSAPAWLWRVADPIDSCSRLSISATFDLSSDSLVVAATFADQFWSDAAARVLRAELPEDLELEMDFQIARPALAIGGQKLGELPERPLPISISVAGDSLRVEGRVRRRDEAMRIIARLRQVRPDLELRHELEIDPGVPRQPVVREALPDFLAFAISGIAGYGHLDLGSGSWRFSADCRDAKFVRAVEGLAIGFEGYCGIPIDLDLRLESGDVLPGIDLELAACTIYFRAGGAQINQGQEEKIDHLAELVTSLAGSTPVTLTGFDGGDGRLALQRARSVRRTLQQAGASGHQFEIRAEPAESGLDWQRDKVSVRFGPRPDET